jgi:epoxyqueuosine reductase
VLGELILTEETDRYDAPFEGSRCGTCRSCIDNCPTGAVAPDRTIDTGRCISCRTIEREQPGQTDLHGWIFGCDACQSLCPWNRRAPQHRNAAFDTVFDPLAMDAEAWLAMDEAEFEARMGTTPLTRSGLARIRSNIAGTPGPE